MPPGRAKVFTEIDHAAAAMEFGLDMRPRTVIVFGNPKLERPPWCPVRTEAIKNSQRETNDQH